ncbi:hypothetical protein L2E82_28439 [Cichorium intybus]|uniref:Uncharacterized protein n=1 Tax=Cichorium intybus TaxID=13427 RepID=A0ACB9CVT7_CICIN|nr:hypothetical protein L2E82_28439 [Cichorium intybus]
MKSKRHCDHSRRNIKIKFIDKILLKINIILNGRPLLDVYRHKPSSDPLLALSLSRMRRRLEEITSF